MDPLTARAYAKVNLALEVLGPRSDGYHEVRTVLQTVSLWDDLECHPDRAITLHCDVADLETPENLAYRAACLLRDTYGVRSGVTIHLRKNIPVGAGLGGGSSDAGATLRALDRLWGLGLPQEALLRLAAELGSDVPFFLHGGTALASGRGEQVAPLPPLHETWLVLVTPPIQLPHKTATLYARLRPEQFSQGEGVEALAQAIRRGEGPSEGGMVNTFEAVAEGVFPGLGDCREAMLEVGAGRVHLTGSGPTLFAVASDAGSGRALERDLLARGLEARLVSTVPG